MAARPWTASPVRDGPSSPRGISSPELAHGPEMRPELAAFERLLVAASRQVQLLATLTPVDARTERERLTRQLRSGRALQPRWRYAPVAHDELRRALDAAERALTAAGPGDPLTQAHASRVRELSVEAALCASAGSPEVAHLAGQRFAPFDADCLRAAAALCDAWLAEPVEDDAAPRIASDDADPRSLLSQLRAEVGRRRLPFAVVVQPSLAPLAATGDQVILVAPGRPMTAEEVARTVLHEVEGHALPRARAAGASLALFRVGTARGVDEQEGLALVLEERNGRLGPHRRRALAARHRAVEAMTHGATFGDVATLLVRDHGVDPADAIVIVERAFRGGDGAGPGLGRERVYLESFVRVREHLRARPEDERVLAAGQVSLDALGALAPFVTPA